MLVRACEVTNMLALKVEYCNKKYYDYLSRTSSQPFKHSSSVLWRRDYPPRQKSHTTLTYYEYHNFSYTFTCSEVTFNIYDRDVEVREMRWGVRLARWLGSLALIDVSASCPKWNPDRMRENVCGDGVSLRRFLSSCSG